ncbi:hypothetical protein WEU38_12150 [Cyanobacterium aponinum AL20118]|uniref:Uncharacterized protein n=1 Tax=Cyanobacterium aponinum AL20115 TaxID=3090662 RepID=A0AAF1C4P7_9CHRO|nr:hypothetical protein [Cyanobacterium aponinum]WPF87566.1 hypothetical protein SAY89_12205 [Cyanobacterium aponinum AL20115]
MAISEAVHIYLNIVKEHHLDELCCMVLPTKKDCCTEPCINYQIAKRKIVRSMKMIESKSAFLNKLNEIADNVDSLIQYFSESENSKHYQQVVGEYIETIHCQIYELNNLHKENKNNG